MATIRKAYPRWKPFMGQHKIKGFPTETVGLSVLGALGAYGIDCMMNLPLSQIQTVAKVDKVGPIFKNILPSFAATTALAGATWWVSGSKTAAFVIEAVGLAFFVPKLVTALFE